MTKISPDAALKVIEVLTNRVGVKIEQEQRVESVAESIMDVNVAFAMLIDTAEKTPQLIPDKLIDLAAVCAIAVASMVAGEVAVAHSKGLKTEVTDATDSELVEEKLSPAEQRALDAMRERMARLRAAAGNFIS